MSDHAAPAIGRTQIGEAMAPPERTTYVAGSANDAEFHEWHERVLEEADRLGIPWGTYIGSLSEQEYPACAASFVAAYRRPPKPNRNGKERPK